MRKNLLIMGTHRSGTSVLSACCVRALGYTGNAIKKAEANPEGFYEDQHLMRANQKQIRKFGGENIINLEDDAAVEIFNLTYMPPIHLAVRSNYLLKDPSTSYLWPSLQKFCNADMVVIARCREEVCESAAKRGIHKDFGPYYDSMMRCALKAVDEEGALLVLHEDIIARPVKTMRIVAAHLGRELDEEEVLKVVHTKDYYVENRPPLEDYILSRASRPE